jgi:hypothetical protein
LLCLGVERETPSDFLYTTLARFAERMIWGVLTVNNEVTQVVAEVRVASRQALVIDLRRIHLTIHYFQRGKRRRRTWILSLKGGRRGGELRTRR